MALEETDRNSKMSGGYFLRDSLGNSQVSLVIKIILKMFQNLQQFQTVSENPKESSEMSSLTCHSELADEYKFLTFRFV